MGLFPQECLFSLAYPKLHSLCSLSILSFELKTAFKERKCCSNFSYDNSHARSAVCESVKVKLLFRAFHISLPEVLACNKPGEA